MRRDVRHGQQRRALAAAAGRGQQAVVARGHLLAQLDLLLEDVQLGQQDGRLQGVQAAVHADPHVVVAAILAVAGDLAQHPGQLVVAGEDRPAVAVAAQRLAGEEAGAGDGGQAARAASLVAGAEALRRVLDHRQAVTGGDGVDGVEVGALAVQRHRHQGAGALGDGCLQQRRVEGAGVRLDVDVHRPRAEQGHGFGGGDEGEAGGDHLVARADAQRHQGDLQGVGAVGAGDAVAGAGEGAQALLQFGHLRAEDVLAVVEDAADAGLDALADALLLGLQVDELDHFRAL